MLKEFAQYLVSLKDNKTYNIHGDTYSDHDLVRIKPHIDRPANLSVSGLDSIVKLVRNELDMFECSSAWTMPARSPWSPPTTT